MNGGLELRWLSTRHQLILHILDEFTLAHQPPINRLGEVQLKLKW